MVDNIKYGLIKAIQLKKVVLLIYLIQLLIAIPLGLQVYQVIEASIGHSLSMNIIQEGFDRTVFEDFLNVHGASITPLVGTLRYIIPTYLLISIFMHAGIIGSLIKGESSVSSFFINGWKYLKPFIGINLAMIVIAFIWSLLIWIPYIIFLGNPVEDHSSEKVFIHSLLVMTLIYISGILFIWIWSLNSKYKNIISGAGIITSLKWGWQLVKSSGKHQIIIFFVFVLIHLIIVAIYFLISNPIGASSIILIAVVMILQQSFALFRIGLRVSLFGSLLKSASQNDFPTM